MDIPKGFKPNHGVDKKTKDLLEGKLKKGGKDLEYLPRDTYSHYYNEPTLERLENIELKSGSFNLACIRIKLEYKDLKYDLNILPHSSDDNYPRITLVQELIIEDGVFINDVPALEELASVIADHYSAPRDAEVFKDFHLQCSLKMYPALKRIQARRLIDDIKNFLIPNFKNVKIDALRYEDPNLKYLAGRAPE